MSASTVVTSKGQWAPGTSGNKRGRPKGSTNKRMQIPAELTAEALTQLAKLVADCDPVAIKMVLDRAIPALRSVTLPGSLDGELLTLKIAELTTFEERLAALEQEAARD